MSQPGAGWREDDPERVALIDRVSISLFGITERDTERPEPDFTQFLTEVDRIAIKHDPLGVERRFRYALEPYRRAVEERDDWEENFDILYDGNFDSDDRDNFWRGLRLDVSAENGEELICLHNFSRQLIVAAKGIMPGAVFTPDGSGTRAPQSTESWGASLEAQAAEFKKRRRK